MKPFLTMILATPLMVYVGITFDMPVLTVLGVGLGQLTAILLAGWVVDKVFSFH